MKTDFDPGSDWKKVNSKTVPYGSRSENCFHYFFTEIDTYGPRTEKKNNFLRTSSFQKLSSEKKGQLSKNSTSEKVDF
jgi:hypothetical protein